MLAAAIALSTAYSASAKELTSVGAFLKDDRGAHLAAMGGIGAAVNRDLYSVMANPASLAGLDRYQAAFEHDAMIFDIAGNFAAIGFPIGERSALGISYNGIDYGSTLRTTVSDPFGSSNASFSGADQAISLHGGYRIRESGFYFGAAYRYYQLEIDRYNASGHAFDLGAQWDLFQYESSGLRLGASVLNFGAATSFRSAKEELPTAWRLGAHYHTRISNFNVEGDADLAGARGEAPHLRLGGAFWPNRWIALRGGYNGSRDLASGMSGGLGFLWNDVNVDYAYIPYGDFGARHRISLGYSWGTDRVPVEHISLEPAFEAERFEPESPAPPRQERRIPKVAAEPFFVPEVISPTPSIRSDDPEEQFQSAARMMAGKHYAEALAVYNRLLESDPTSVRALFNLGTAHFALRNYSEARVHYERGLGYQPDDAEAWLYLGISQYKLGDTDGAVVSLKQTLRLEPGNSVAARFLALLPEKRDEVEAMYQSAAEMMRREDYPSALAVYSRLREYDSTSARVLFNLGTAHLGMKNHSAAKAYYEEGIAYHPDDAGLWLHLGISQFRLGEIDAAIESWNRTLELDPENEEARGYLASVGR